MKEENRRDSKRHKCGRLANLTCEGEVCGLEEYHSIRIIDQSDSGMRIESKNPIDTSSMLTVTMNSADTLESYPAEFIWMYRNANMYVAGLKKI